MKNLEKVQNYSLNGYNCAQCILAAYADECGLTEETALKLARNLGSGIAYRGEMCGAILAALLVYSLKFGSDKPNDELAEEIVYNLSKEHIEAFEKLHGSVHCKQLLGYDPSIPEEMHEITDQSLYKWKCPNFVRDSAKILEMNIQKMKK